MDNTNEEDTRKWTQAEVTKLVIVGGGIAGLAAAFKLEQFLFKDYILLEAQSELGGRIKSVKWGDGWLEEGAQFLHGTESELGDLIKRNDLLGEEVLEGQGMFIREDGSTAPKTFIKRANNYIKKVLEDCVVYTHYDATEKLEYDDNLGKKLSQEYEKFTFSRNETYSQEMLRDELYDWNVRFLCIDNACTSLEELSLEKWGEFITVDGPENSIFKTHYGSIVEKIASNLTRDNIRLNCPVKKIEWDKENTSKDVKPILVTLNNGNKIVADCAIVTCSLGYLKEKHEKLFSPMLPTYYTNVIENMGFGVINKVFLEFDKPWWEREIKGFQFLWADTHPGKTVCCSKERTCLAPWTRDLTGFDMVPRHPNMLLGWVGRNGAKIIESIDEDQIIKDCAQLFRFFLKQTIPDARRCLRTRWGSNEFIKGAYCHLSKKCEASGGPNILSEPICRKIICDDGTMKSVPVLMLAGEATSLAHYSTTHGAYDTGAKRAEFFLHTHLDKNSN